MPKNFYDWETLDAQIAHIIESEPGITMSALARRISVNRSPLKDHLRNEYDVSAKTLKSFPEKYKYKIQQVQVVEDFPGDEESTIDDEPQDEEETNTRVISFKGWGDRIATLDDLIKACKVDLNIWAVERHIINKWEVGRAEKSKNIIYTADGKKGFDKDTGKVFVEPLIQVKAWLVRKEPVAVHPVLHMLEAATLTPIPTKPVGERPLRVLFIPDTHVGFARNIHGTGRLLPMHDRRVLDIAVQYADIHKPDIIVFLGDFMDMAEWSTRWATDPEFVWTTQPSIVEGHWWLTQLRHAAPEAQMYILEGNHDRYKQAITAHLSAAYELTGMNAAGALSENPLLSMQNIFQLDALGVQFIEGYEQGVAELWLADNFLATHGRHSSSTPGASVKKMSDIFPFTVVMGHIHRREMVSRKQKVRHGWVIHTAICPGTACHVDGRLPGSDDYQQWQQGLLVSTFTPDDLQVEPQLMQIAIHEGRAMVDGDLYVARDLEQELDDMLSDKMAQIKTRHQRMAARENQAHL
jgi:metallophosphoesterase superfamily enzyme